MKRYLLTIIITLTIIFAGSLSVFGQGPGGPPDPGAPPTKANPPLGGGSAPIGGGVAVLLGLGAVYALGKYRQYIVHSDNTNSPTH